jgi:hypothetical protein
MHSLVDHLNSDDERQEILKAIRERWGSGLDDRDRKVKNWRRIYKALVLYEYLILHGPEEHVNGLLIEDGPELRRLEFFLIPIEKNEPKDLGQSVRIKSKAIREVLSSSDQLIQMRKEALNRHQTMKNRKAADINSTNLSSNRNLMKSEETSEPPVFSLDSKSNGYINLGSKSDSFHSLVHVDDDFSEFQSAAENHGTSRDKFYFTSDSSGFNALDSGQSLEINTSSRAADVSQQDTALESSKSSLADYLELHKHILDI